MKSPQDMRIIQIDITNACIHNCSNCTRFCGHHKKPFFMSLETFERAVDSLDGYVGTVSMMGGEPTLHPEFEHLIKYLASKYPKKEKNPLLKPQRNFLDAIHEVEMDHVFLHPCKADPSGYRQTVQGPGLWSAMGGQYKKYYELIQDSICYQALNDHSHVMYHQPALISRSALGIPDDEWVELRDNCWVQNLWSACVTTKGAFFCEVAGALDMLFDGPGGWPIEPGWWKRTPEEFRDQLHWCELCGLALNTFSRNANEEIDDVSADIYERLKNVGSRKIGTKHINVVKITDGRIHEESMAKGKWFEGSMPYAESYVAKLDKAAHDLSYKNIVRIESHRGKALGYQILKELFGADYNTWALVIEGNVDTKKAQERLEKLILNPGVLLYRTEDAGVEDEYFKFKTSGSVMLLSANALSLKKIGWDRILRMQSSKEFVDEWDAEKVLSFSLDSEQESIGSEIQRGLRYLVYGAGDTAPVALRHIRECGAECIGLVDRDTGKWGRTVDGTVIYPPEFVTENKNLYDKILIASTRYYSEIRDTLLDMGFSKSELCWWM